MLNQIFASAEPSLKINAAKDWELGETPGRWDVSFGERVRTAVSRWLSRNQVSRIKIEPETQNVSARRAA